MNAAADAAADRTADTVAHASDGPHPRSPAPGSRPPAETFDAIVVGGGPAGATAAHELARSGHRVLLLDRAGRPKPCGGAIPPRLIRDFAIPDHLLVARARCARMISPSGATVDIPIENGFVGLVDRDGFDEWLRERAASAGVQRRTGVFERFARDPDGMACIEYRAVGAAPADGGQTVRIRARAVIGADGARSGVARQAVPGAGHGRWVFAYHEIVAAPQGNAAPAADWDGDRCDVYYRGRLSPDFYAWVFPHGATASIGTGSADKGFSLRRAVSQLREDIGLADAVTVRKEGAPLPMKPLPVWDNRRDVVLAGDAAGVVAPASGEGIYYAMVSGQFAAQGVHELLSTGDSRALARVRRRFLSEHGRVFWLLAIMQRFWYSSEKRRERFVHICRDRDVQQLTFDAYMNKRLVRARPLAHLRIFLKDTAHLLGLARL